MSRLENYGKYLYKLKGSEELERIVIACRGLGIYMERKILGLFR